jgi:hypothetical protein
MNGILDMDKHNVANMHLKRTLSVVTLGSALGSLAAAPAGSPAPTGLSRPRRAARPATTASSPRTAATSPSASSGRPR